MSNLSARQSNFEEIRRLLANLSVEERLRLISELSIHLHKEITAQSTEMPPSVASAGTLKGKYAYVPTSSERFAERKQQEIDLER